eukprot:m.13112 g.13112  ORF g.13112 m.13112 type:complete len:412 (+) comp4458_c0_seq1:82-1317(+)
MMSDQQAQPSAPNLDNAAEEEFRSPSKVLSSESGMTFDASQLDQLGHVGKKAASMDALLRQSLYVKFDPLVGNQKEPAHNARMHTPKGVANVARAMSEKLLDIDTPEMRTLPPQARATSCSSSTDPQTTPLRREAAPSRRDPVVDADTAKPESSDAAGRSSSEQQASSESSAGQQGAPASASASGESASNSSGQMYTQEELNKQVAEARMQASQEAEILQMEIEELQSKLKVEQENNQQMTTVVEEYGTAMAKIVENQGAGEKDLEQEVEQLQLEKQQVEGDLRKTETAFSDLHHKYEKLKDLAENFKKNEKTLTTALETAQVALKQSEERYDTLKAHAEEKIKKANMEIANVREADHTAIEVANAKIKKAEAQVVRLQRQLESKEKDNQELTSICDDLVKQLDDLTTKKA